MRKKIVIAFGIVLVVSTIILLAITNKNTSNDTINFNIISKNGETMLKIDTQKNNKIYYTLDGTVPTKKSKQYIKEIKLNQNTSPNTLSDPKNSEKIYGKEILENNTLPKGVVIRAIAISQTGKKSKVFTKTYFPNVDIKKEFPNTIIVSLVTAPQNLLDYKTGIMVKGEIYDNWLQQNNKEIKKEDELVNKEFVDGNFMQHGKEWERECNIEIFDNNNNSIVNELAGVRIKGNISRMYNQKSLNIYFREKYGKDYINYPLFPQSTNINNQTITQYKSITLRNGGNDTEISKYKDDWLQKLVKDRSVDTQSSKIAVLFINGEYWGVYTFQEKYSEDYYAEHYNLDRDNIIAIKEDEVEIGEDEDFTKYKELMEYAKKDLTNSEIYKEFLKLVDIQSMLDYYAIQTYINNADWGMNESNINKNVMLWRTREKEDSPYGDTKWRWTLYDLEFSSSLYNTYETSADFCSIENAQKKHPLFASAMKNQDFNKLFYDTYFELRNNNFEINRIKSTINTEHQLWEPLMENHYKRFGDNNVQRYISKNSTIKYFEQKIYSNPC